MTKFIVCGCNGKMGRMLTQCIAGRDDCEIVAGFDINTASNSGYPVFASPVNCSVAADVIVDFSRPESLPAVLDYAVEHRIPAVICTTGLSDGDKLLMQKAAEIVPIFFSANMSIGVSLLAELARKAAAVLGNDFDVEILEKHHNQKVDAPSGTALMLADAVAEGLDYTPQYVFERHSTREKRSKHEIGISAIRGGTIVGEHDVMFCGRDEVITLSHHAASKELFAVGAINAALFLIGKPAALYNMRDFVSAV
ncbi:MAG: 4-hydroxy-tetrahydrodipicolinate reductase [Clostridia bacterium]|nr:4-hydroxy-tetrahydrodipicolinate reductase [Clostridia bacterium]